MINCEALVVMNLQTEDSFATLLELAANNDIEAFKKCIEQGPSRIDEIGQWYGREKGSNRMALHHRTPLMVASTYGSIDILKFLTSSSEVDPNQSCGIDKSTALHCAASSGSVNAVDTVKLLLAAGADPSLPNANGLCPFQVIDVSPKFQSVKDSLQMMLANSPPSLEKKEYPFDPSLPDIKNGIFSTDEFRMYLFKVRPCSRAYSHDWTECPFVHPGENARRRDPRKFHYSCVPCLDFRKGACGRGDLCEYAHGVFECWLHPAQYRTRLCKDGSSCNRRVCFFAHKQEEVRSLYASTGSPVSPPTNSIWANHQNIPALHLPGNHLLRTSMKPRVFPIEDMSLFPDMRNEQSLMSPQSSMNRFCRPNSLNLSNMDDIHSAESSSSSPRYSDPAFFSPTKKTIWASPRNVGSLSSRNLGTNETWSKWGPPNEWPIAADEYGKLKRLSSSSFELLNNNMEEEPDLSWVQSLVKDSSHDMKEDIYAPHMANEGVSSVNNNSQIEQVDQSNLGAWFEQMQLDRLMAQ